MTTEHLATNVKIQIDGADVTGEVMANLAALSVDQHVHLPDVCSIRILAPDVALIDESPFDLLKRVKIEAGDEEGEMHALFDGEVTALEPQFNEGMVAELVVRGYDRSHRLYRETKSRAFLNQKDSDLAQSMAGEAGLQTDIEATSTVYDHIFQDNQSDLSFLTQRAWRIGYECFVEDGKLIFRRPPGSPEAIELIWGQNLLAFYPRMSVAEQVDEVVVRGWDATNQQAVVGRAQANSSPLYPSLRDSKTGADWSAEAGGGKLIVVDQPVVSQAEADALAQARLNEVAGAFVSAEGRALSRPDLRAGRAVTLSGLGDRFSGQYLVTRANHLYDTATGFTTEFVVSGARLGMLAEQGAVTELRRWPGAAVAIVTNTADPDGWGRIKVKYPWLTDDAESDWARIVSAGAGHEAGFYAVPEVGDEVAVLFEHGDFNRPLVLGGLWNGQNAVPPEAATDDTAPQTRVWRSLAGNAITLHDTDEKIEIVTPGGHKIVLDDANSKIEIVSSGGQSVVIDDGGNKVTLGGGGDVDMESSAGFTIKSGANLKIEAGGNLDLEASGMVTIKGAKVDLNP